MEFFEYITYTLIFLVLMAFIGVISYIIYDNYTYKNNLTSDLNTNFVDINKNFDSTSNIMNKLYRKHSSNINVLETNIIDINSRHTASSNLFTNNIIDINSRHTASSNIFIDINSRHTASSNLFIDINSRHTASSNLFTSNIDTFSYNLNKFFTFKNNTDNFNDTNKKIYEYRTFDNHISKLELIAKTTAISGLQLNTDTNKELGICNSDGTKCFHVLSTDDKLSIYKPTNQGGSRDIYLGGSDQNDAPFKIVGGEVFIKGHKYVAEPQVITKSVESVTLNQGGGGNGYTRVPTVTISGGGGSGAIVKAVLTPTTIASYTVTSGGSGYTSLPEVTISGGGGYGATAIPTLANGSVTNIAVNLPGSGFTGTPTVAITGGGGGTGATAVANFSPTTIASYTVTSGGSGYTSPPSVTIIAIDSTGGTGATATAVLSST